MKVAIVCPYDIGAPGGVQAQVIGLANELARFDVDAWIVAPGDSTMAPVRSVGTSRRIRSNDSVAPVSIDLRSWRRVGAATSDADVVHIHEPFMPLVSWAAHAVPAARILTFHADPPSWVHRLYSAGRSLMSKTVDGAAMVTAVSPVAAAALESFAKEVTIVPNGVSIPDSSPPTTDRHGVVFVGRDEPRKGLDVLLHAWPLVRTEFENARLTVIGNAYPMDIPGVTFAGVCPDAEKFAILRSSAVFVAPNRRGESFGITVAEAMANGCAVVASDIPAFRHVGDDVPEFVPPGDASVLADALVALLGDDGRVADMAARGVVRAQSFGWDAIVRTYLEMYHNAAFT